MPYKHKRKPSSYAEKYILNVPDPGKDLPYTRKPPVKHIKPVKRMEPAEQKDGLSAADRNSIILLFIVAFYILAKIFG